MLNLLYKMTLRHLQPLFSNFKKYFMEIYTMYR